MTYASLSKVAESFISDDPITKPLTYYQRYEEHLRRNNLIPGTILEIGVYKGESTKVLAKTFPDSRVVALDLHLKEIDFSEFPNIRYIQADQSDPQKLCKIIEQEFPAGIDLVIEDASHIGALSHITFFTVFPYLVAGGVYIVEDWGTGYMDDWPDGRGYQAERVGLLGRIRNRIKSHDYGMVGFVKSLIDLTHDRVPRQIRNDSSVQSPVMSIEFSSGICILRKAYCVPEMTIRLSDLSRARAKPKSIRTRARNVLRMVRYILK